MKPLVYQADGLDKLEAARKRGRKKLLVVMATGLGKTVVAGFELERLLEEDPGRVLFLSHDTRINAQGRETYEEMFGDKYTHGNFNGEEKHLHRVDFLYATFQTMANHRQKFGRREFKYIVIDESHHLMAETFFPTVEYFIPKLFLGLTATPERTDGLDITDFFGEPVINLGLFKALAKGYLCEVDYRLMTDEIQNLDVLDTPVGKLSIAELNRRLFIPKRDEEMVRLIAEKSAAVKNPRTIIFCASVQHAENLAKLIPDSVVLHSKVKGKKERKRRLDAFRSGEAKTILTVDMLNEGINVPEANILVFARSTASRRIYLQELGRGLRWAEGKVLLVLDFVANCERIEWIDEVLTGVREEADDEWDDPLAGEGQGGGRAYGPSITLTIDGGEFDERVYKLFDIVRDARLKSSRYGRGADTQDGLSYIRAHAERLGKTPTAVEFDAVRTTYKYPSSGWYKERFGTWNEAVKAAGLRPNMDRNITDEQLIKELKALGKILGRAPFISDVQVESTEGRMVSAAVYTGRFGSWADVLKKADFKPNRLRGVSDEEMLKALKAGAESLGRTPGEDDLKGLGLPGATTYSRRFGTLNKAIVAAGLTPRKTVTQFSREDKIKQLKKLAQELGRAPSTSDVAAAQASGKCASVTAITKEFETFNKALLAAGLKPGRRRHSKAELKQQLLAKATDGKMPSQRDVNGDPAMADASSIVRVFGVSWSDIAQEVGLQPSKIVNPASKKE